MNTTKDNLKHSSDYLNKKFSTFDILIEKIKGKNEISQIDEISQIQTLLKEIEIKIDLMNFDKHDLKSELDKNEWEKEIKEYKSKFRKCNETFNSLPIKKEIENTDPENIDESIEHNNLTIEEEYKRGTKILDADDKILGELIDIISKDGETIIVVKQNLDTQTGKLENIDPMFKEMEFSLERAGKKVKKMMIELSKDKIIICLIAIISIIILSIIIVSLCGGDKNNNNYNLPFDIFQSNKKNNNITTYEYSLCLVNKYYYTIIFLLLLFL